MKLDELYNEYDMLQGNINRMFLTKDKIEFVTMSKFAKKRLEHLINELYAGKFEEVTDDDTV